MYMYPTGNLTLKAKSDPTNIFKKGISQKSFGLVRSPQKKQKTETDRQAGSMEQTRPNINNSGLKS